MSDPPLVKLTNLLLLDMIKRKTPSVCVSRGRGVEALVDGAWRPSFAEHIPAKLRDPVIRRLCLMADIADAANVAWGGRIRLDVGKGRLHDFAAVFSRGDAGSTIVLTAVPVAPRVLSDPELARRAAILVAQAHGAASRDDVRARTREAIALLPEGDGARCGALVDAAAACARAGLFDDAREYLELALPLTAQALHRLDIELMLGWIAMNTSALDDAVCWCERAVATGSSVGAADVYAYDAHVALSHAHDDREDLDAYERHIARAETIVWRTFGRSSAAALSCRAERVRLMRQRGDAKGAETLALGSLDAALRYDLAEAVDALRFELAELALARGDAGGAFPYLRTLLQRRSLHPSRANVHVRLARALHALGRRDEALAALRSADAVADVLAHDHPTRADIARETALLGATAPYR